MPPPIKNFFIRTATRFDYNLIRYGLKRFYWPYDPFSIEWKNQNPPSLMEFKWTMTKVLNGNNLVAFNDQEKSHFVGFIVNNKWTLNSTNDIIKLANDNNDLRLLTIGTLQQMIENELDIYNKFNINNVFLISNVGVHPDYFRQSLGTQLISNSINLAKELGYKLIVVYANGTHSKSICEKNHMIEIMNFKYSKLINKFHNIDLFDSNFSNREFLVYVKEINK